jgi:hypothetical protein
VERIFEIASRILLQPTRGLTNLVHPRAFGKPEELVLLLANSLCWGLVLAIIVRRLTLSSTRTPPALPVLLFLVLASSAPLIVSVQAVPVSSLR